MDIFEKVEKCRPGTELGVEKKDGRLLHKFVIDNGIKKVVETGVCFGFSSSYFLDAVGDDGLVISIEPRLKPLKELVVPDSFHKRWIPIQNFSDYVLESIMKAYSPVDLFFHDSRHFIDTMTMEYTIADKYAPRFIGSDDVDWPRSDQAWYKFLAKYGYREVLKGSRFAIAEKRR